MINIDIMLSRPGIYLVVTSKAMAFCEVADGGQCFQLEPHSGTYARDGELAAGGWKLQNLRAIHGPFGRVPVRVKA